MKTLKLKVLVFIAMLVFSETVFPSCLKALPAKEEVGRSDLVFIGTVVKTQPAQLAGADLVDGKRLKWRKSFSRTDVVAFRVIEAFKGDLGETIEIATSADGDAGYKFEGGAWLKENRTYLVYASRIVPAGTVETHYSTEEYSPEIIAEFQRIQKSLPKALAAEINEDNRKISAYYVGICGRTKQIDRADEEVLQLRELFPDSKKASSANAAPSTSVFRMPLDFLRFV